VDNGFVFATTIGSPIDSQNIINRHFRPLLRHAGLLDIRWHDLRHTCVTLLLSRGSRPKLIQHLLSRSSIQLTLDRYSHWMSSMGRSIPDGMDEALSQAPYSCPSLPLGTGSGRSHGET
jgi:integrase